MRDGSELMLIDWEASVKLADNDPELATDILTLTSRSLPKDMQEIAQAFEKHDEREMRRLLHKLEGGISYAKFPRLETATLTLHQAVKDSETETFDTLHQSLQQILIDTTAAIDKKISTR